MALLEALLNPVRCFERTIDEFLMHGDHDFYQQYEGFYDLANNEEQALGHREAEDLCDPPSWESFDL